MGSHLSTASANASRQNSSKSDSEDLYRIFTLPDDRKKLDKEEINGVKVISKELGRLGLTSLKEPQIEYALRSLAAKGDKDKALELLVVLEDSLEGIVKDYDPSVELLGAVNRQAVTCYLDALLFAMFARLDSFEAMVFDSFVELPRKRLAALLRLWVNMLRSGKLITVDIV